MIVVCLIVVDFLVVFYLSKGDTFDETPALKMDIFHSSFFDPTAT